MGREGRSEDNKSMETGLGVSGSLRLSFFPASKTSGCVSLVKYWGLRGRKDSQIVHSCECLEGYWIFDGIFNMNYMPVTGQSVYCWQWVLEF